MGGARDRARARLRPRRLDTGHELAGPGGRRRVPPLRGPDRRRRRRHPAVARARLPGRPDAARGVARAAPRLRPAAGRARRVLGWRAVREPAARVPGRVPGADRRRLRRLPRPSRREHRGRARAAPRRLAAPARDGAPRALRLAERDPVDRRPPARHRGDGRGVAAGMARRRPRHHRRAPGEGAERDHRPDRARAAGRGRGATRAAAIGVGARRHRRPAPCPRGAGDHRRRRRRAAGDRRPRRTDGAGGAEHLRPAVRQRTVVPLRRRLPARLARGRRCSTSSGWGCSSPSAATTGGSSPGRWCRCCSSPR